MPSYIEDFAANLRSHIENRLKLVVVEPLTDVGDTESSGMQRLYGSDVLPDRLVATLHDSLGDSEVLCLPGTDRARVANDLLCGALSPHPHGRRAPHRDQILYVRGVRFCITSDETS